MSCIDVYTVGNYFNMTPMTKIAMDNLTSDFDGKVGPMQQHDDPVDYMDERLNARKLVYQDVPFTDTNPAPYCRDFSTLFTPLDTTSCRMRCSVRSWTAPSSSPSASSA